MAKVEGHCAFLCGVSTPQCVNKLDGQKGGLTTLHSIDGLKIDFRFWLEQQQNHTITFCFASSQEVLRDSRFVRFDSLLFPSSVSTLQS
jgi:hypothetical protein